MINGQVVSAGMASIPKREDSMALAIRSLVGQVDALYVSLNAGYSDVPEWGRGLKNVHWFQDTDACMFERGKFQMANKVKGYFFTVDDDITYPTDYVERMIAFIEEFDRKAVVCVHGSDMIYPFRNYYVSRRCYHLTWFKSDTTCVDIPGTGTTAFHTDCLRLNLNDFPTPFMSDIWLGGLLRERGIRCVCVKRPGTWLKGRRLSGLYEKAQANPVLVEAQTELCKKFFPK